ncbi:MAG: phage holin family protein [Cyclobacteriaceae bacterium]|jgi:putative membrane protein
MLLRFLLNGIAVMLTAWLLPGVHVEHFGYALLAAAMLSLANTFIKPLLILLTIPLTIFTLGLFLLAINAIVILLVEDFIPGFQVDGFWWALLFSLIMSVFNSMIKDLTKKES